MEGVLLAPFLFFLLPLVVLTKITLGVFLRGMNSHLLNLLSILATPFVVFSVLLVLSTLLPLWVEPRLIPPVDIGDSFASVVSLIYSFPAYILLAALFGVLELFDIFKKK